MPSPFTGVGPSSWFLLLAPPVKHLENLSDLPVSDFHQQVSAKGQARLKTWVQLLPKTGQNRDLGCRTKLSDNKIVFPLAFRDQGVGITDTGITFTQAGVPVPVPRALSPYLRANQRLSPPSSCSGRFTGFLSKGAPEPFPFGPPVPKIHVLPPYPSL